MSMNFPQMAFGAQYNMQSPSLFSSSPPSPSTASAMLVPPSWATEIMGIIKTIKSSMTKIDNVEKMVNKMTIQVDTLESTVKAIDTGVIDVEKSKEFLSNGFEETKEKRKFANEEFTRLTKNNAKAPKTASNNKNLKVKH